MFSFDLNIPSIPNYLIIPTLNENNRQIDRYLIKLSNRIYFLTVYRGEHQLTLYVLLK